MKRLLSLAVPLTLLAACSAKQPAPAPPAPVAPTALERIGEFESSVEVPLVSVTQDQCLERHGAWMGKSCVVAAMNTVRVIQDGDHLTAEIKYLGSDRKACTFRGPAEPNGEKILIVTPASKPECRLTLTFANSNGLSVRTNAACRCPKDTAMKIPFATRKKESSP